MQSLLYLEGKSAENLYKDIHKSAILSSIALFGCGILAFFVRKDLKEMKKIVAKMNENCCKND